MEQVREILSSSDVPLLALKKQTAMLWRGSCGKEQTVTSES